MTDRLSDPSSDAPVFGDDAGGLPENLLRHYAAVLRRRSKWIGLGLVVGLLAGFGSTFLVKKHRVTTHFYKATNTLVVDTSSQGGSDGGGGGYSLQQAAVLVQSQSLLDEVGKRLGLSPDQVSQQLSATTRSDVQAIDVTGIATSPQLATNLANTGAAILQDVAEKSARDQAVRSRKQTQDRLDELEKQRQDLIDQIAQKPPNADLLNQQLNSVVNDYGQYYSQLQNMGTSTQSLTFSTLQPANPIEINGAWFAWRTNQNVNARNQINTSDSSKPPSVSETDLSTAAPLSKSTRVVLGASAGLVLGLISAFLVEAWDDRIRRREKVEELTGLPVLAEVPRLHREQARSHSLAVVDDSTSPASERYRSARTSILFALEGRGAETDDGTRRAPVVMVTSPSPGEGKTTTAANLAAAFADGGLRTLVIDGDFRRPSIRRHLSPVPNLVSPDDPCDTRIERVRFLAGPHGMRSPDEAVLELRRSIERWRDDYDIVVLDTPPILTTNDAAELLNAAEAVVLVLRAGQTRTGPARRVVSLLNRFRADVLGVVLNSCDRSEMDPYYGYGYGYLGKKSSDAGNEPSARGDDRRSAPSDSANADKGVDAKGMSELSDELSEFWSARGGHGNGHAPHGGSGSNGSNGAGGRTVAAEPDASGDRPAAT